MPGQAALTAAAAAAPEASMGGESSASAGASESPSLGVSSAVESAVVTAPERSPPAVVQHSFSSADVELVGVVVEPARSPALDVPAAPALAKASPPPPAAVSPSGAASQAPQVEVKVQVKEEAPKEQPAKEEAPKEEPAEEDSGEAAAAPSSNNPYLALAVDDNDDNEGGGADSKVPALREPPRQSPAELAGAALRILCLGGLGEVLGEATGGDSATAAEAAGRNAATPLAGSSVSTPGWQHRLQPRGLVNTGNSCFINSILQVSGDGTTGEGAGVADVRLSPSPSPSYVHTYTYLSSHDLTSPPYLQTRTHRL